MPSFLKNDESQGHTDTKHEAATRLLLGKFCKVLHIKSFKNISSLRLNNKLADTPTCSPINNI
jgi:hypothetical protein